MYPFWVLPFGLASAPRIFTKVTKLLVGIRMIIYLDDIIIINQSQGQLLQDRNSMIWLLQHLDFVINWKKSALAPTQIVDYLGFVINSV